MGSEMCIRDRAMDLFQGFRSSTMEEEEALVQFQDVIDNDSMMMMNHAGHL